jgi:hypothetical protein
MNESTQRGQGTVSLLDPERYTKNVIELFELAQKTAHDWCCEFINTEHVLYEMLTYRTPVRSILVAMGFDMTSLAETLKGLFKPGDDMNHDREIKFGWKVENVLSAARAEAMCEKVDAVYLLLGMLRYTDCSSGYVLTKHGVTYEKVKAWIDPGKSYTHQTPDAPFIPSSNGLDYLTALRAMEGGAKIRRHDCSRMYECRDHWVWDLIKNDAATFFVWDQLATDWEIVDETPKTMAFVEALQQARSGKKIARLSWKKGVYADFCPPYGKLVKRWSAADIVNVELTEDNVDATDWYVLD